MEKFLFVALLFFLYSCTDDNPVVIEEKGNGIDIDSVINNTNTEFIYFEDEDSTYFFPEELFTENNANTYSEEPELLRLMMKNDTQYRCGINISDLDIFSSIYPHTIGPFEYANLHLIDLLNDVQDFYGPTDDYNYLGSTDFGDLGQFSLTINSLENRLINCSFGGVIETGTGRKINVQNGKLRILIKN